MAPKWQKMTQKWPKMALECSKMAQKLPQMAQKWRPDLRTFSAFFFDWKNFFAFRMYGYNIDITLSFATMPDTYLVQRISICFFFILLLWSDFQAEVPFVDKDKKLNKFGTLEATTFCVIAFNPNLSNKNPMLPQNIKDAYQFFLESLSHLWRLHSRLF